MSRKTHHSRDERDRFRENVTDIMDGYDAVADDLAQELAEKRNYRTIRRVVIGGTIVLAALIVLRAAIYLGLF